MQLEQTLRTLCALPAVSGFEMQAAKAVAELFRPYCDTVDADKNGNVIGSLSCGKEGAKTVLLDAHLDQIGFLVTEVLDGGFLRFAPVGGVDPRMLLGGEVTILADEPLYGVVSCMPPHLLKAGEQNKAVPIDQMAIDTGLLDAKSRIRVGTPIVFAQQPIKLAGGQLCSKCLDDRAGVAAILLAMEQLHAAKDKLKCNVAVLISTQEEVTELGAQTGAFTVQPEYAIAVDVTHGRTPDGPSDGVFDLAAAWQSAWVRTCTAASPRRSSRPPRRTTSTIRSKSWRATPARMRGRCRSSAAVSQWVCCPFRKNTCIRRSRS